MFALTTTTLCSSAYLVTIGTITLCAGCGLPPQRCLRAAVPRQEEPGRQVDLEGEVQRGEARVADKALEHPLLAPAVLVRQVAAAAGGGVIQFSYCF